MDGTIITANENFCNAVGYSLDEIKGQHHRMFVEREYGESMAYRDFWQKLNRGEYETAEYKRVAKGGREIWIQASYNPILDLNGKPFKVVKYATEVTQAKLANANFEGQINAISKSLAVIEFNMDGTIITAIENFLCTVGYRLEEIRGEHHRMFVGEEYSESLEYKAFWERLRRGEYESSEYKRYGKGGHEIWIQASYNPILDLNGKPFKVVKFATDITQQKVQAEENAKVSKIVNALDNCQSCLMLADKNNSVVYCNNRSRQMFEKRDEKIREIVKDFSSSNLMGFNFVELFEDRDAIMSDLMRLREPKIVELKLNGLTFSVTMSSWKDQDNEDMGTVLDWKDVTDELALALVEKREADANARVKQALDVVATNTMIADTDFNIVYMNRAVKSLMKDAESDFRKDLPNFDSGTLMGTNIDVFHKNPAHQRSMIAAMSNSFSTKIVLGGRDFALKANPIKNDEGTRIGTILEWTERTEEVATENEIDRLVKAAAEGDLSIRLDTEGKEGFFLNLGTGLNRLVGIADDVVNDTIRIFDALAHGNLTRNIDAEYEGAFGKLKLDANTTVERLTDIINNIREAASAVSTGAIEIAQGNGDLSKRTESQASSLEETASSMEEMTSAVKQTSENSTHANELAISAKTKAQEGGNVVSKAVTAMDEINHASKKIADIIGVIDEIAFQTNLLALNAAVEAARAGEQGRGFAVVAGEVRNLAQRSAGAAKEIKDLIRDSVDKVDVGTALVNESGATLADIIESVDRVSLMIQEISTAASEQSSGIDQVNSAVAQMDEMTQQNAALVEEATAAGEAMAEQAKGMMQMMNFFNLSHSAATGTDSSRENMPSYEGQPVNATSTARINVQKSDYSPSSNASGPTNDAGGESGLSVKSDKDDWQEF